MARLIEHARVSTASQTTDPQVEELKKAGCDRIFSEKVSSRTPEEKRIQLQACLATLEEGDELVVAKLDRLGRTMVEVINRLDDLQTKGIYVRTLDGLLNTRALGKMAPLVVGLLTGLGAEVERSLIVEHSRESIEHRRRTGGDLGGRPELTPDQERPHRSVEVRRSLVKADPNTHRSITLSSTEGMQRA